MVRLIAVDGLPDCIGNTEGYLCLGQRRAFPAIHVLIVGSAFISLGKQDQPLLKGLFMRKYSLQ